MQQNFSQKNIEGYINGIGQYLEAIQRTSISIPERDLTIISNSIHAIFSLLEVIKGVTK